MANIHITRRHALGLERARAEVQSIAETLAQDLHARYEWQGDELHFKRSGGSGRIAVDEDRIDLRIHLGLLLSPLKGTIEQTIHARLDEALGPDASAEPKESS
jgi:putative polyhydroxyalkanoate system protein